MSSPGASQALTRPDLRNAVVSEWDVNGEKANFIADQVGKRIDVDFAAGKIKRIPREAFTKDANTLNRGPGGSYSTSTWGDENLEFFTKEQGHEIPVDEEMASQCKIYYDAELAAARICMSKVMRKHEIDVAAAVMNTTTFAGASLTTAGSVNWTTTPATAVPIDDVTSAALKVRQNCGRVANSIILSYTLWKKLIAVTQIVNRINGGATSQLPAAVQMAAVAQLFDLERIIIAKGIKDTAAEGQTFTAGDIWAADKAMVCYINPAANLQDINLCNVYNWEGSGGSWDWTFETYRFEKNRTDTVRARRNVGIKVEYPECGHLITGLG